MDIRCPLGHLRTYGFVQNFFIGPRLLWTTIRGALLLWSEFFACISSLQPQLPSLNLWVSSKAMNACLHGGQGGSKCPSYEMWQPMMHAFPRAEMPVYYITWGWWPSMWTFSLELARCAKKRNCYMGKHCRSTVGAWLILNGHFLSPMWIPLPIWLGTKQLQEELSTTSSMKTCSNLQIV